MVNIRYLIYVICNGAPAGDVAAAEAYGEELFRLEMICSASHDFDDSEDDADLVAVAVNNMAYICRDLGTERFAPFFQRCIEVMAKLLSSIPPSDETGDDAVFIGLIDAVSDAIETLASVYSTAFLPALPVLFPAISALASTGSSGKHKTPNPFRFLHRMVHLIIVISAYRLRCRGHHRLHGRIPRTRCDSSSCSHDAALHQFLNFLSCFST